MTRKVIMLLKVIFRMFCMFGLTIMFFLLNRTNRNIEVTKTENEIVIKCKEEPSNIVLLVNQMIMPYQYEDGACVYHIERDWIGDTSKAVLYRFSDLTLTHIEL